MLHDKSTKIISELKNYFSSNEKIFQTLFSELRSLKISDKFFVSVDKINTKYVGYQRFVMLILFPLVSKLDEKAFEIYATRWSIEIFFKECKQYLRLGKCESRDFDAQIAATTLCILQFNLFSVIKRFECYESFGGLFRQTKAETIELNVKERILLIIIEITTKLSEIFAIELDVLMFHITSDNQELTNILNLKSLAKSS